MKCNKTSRTKRRREYGELQRSAKNKLKKGGETNSEGGPKKALGGGRRTIVTRSSFRLFFNRSAWRIGGTLQLRCMWHKRESKGPKPTSDVKSILGVFEIEAFDPVVSSLLLLMHMLHCMHP
jgi:hypothetical protein